MECKISHSKAEFDRDAKRFVLNMERQTRKLHIKNCPRCQYAGIFYKYLDFDTLEEAKQSGEVFTLCGNCFKE